MPSIPPLWPPLLSTQASLPAPLPSLWSSECLCLSASEPCPGLWGDLGLGQHEKSYTDPVQPGFLLGSQPLRILPQQSSSLIIRKLKHSQPQRVSSFVLPPPCLEHLPLPVCTALRSLHDPAGEALSSAASVCFPPQSPVYAAFTVSSV